VTYRERQRLTDIQAAINAIRSHQQRGDLSDGLVFDAVRIRLLEIGEASLGYEQFQDWEGGRSWNLGGTYLVVEQSPAMTAPGHDRLRPGLNHLAFHAGPREQVDKLAAAAPEHGWTLLFPDRHPHAGGPGHYAAYLASTDGYEVELVADDAEEASS
jgi:catechol 2,3-dioxygenase-like lactoylglutathione lyase family enzyme